jgi:thiamine biosynthesis lipoprotein
MTLAAEARGATSAIHPAALATTLLLAGCGQPEEQRLTVYTGPTMGTQYMVKITDQPGSLNREQVAKGIESVLNSVNAAMSTYRPDSELSRFNAQSTTDWIAVSSELATLCGEARRISEDSNGAFDVTVGPLVNLWGFGPGDQVTSPPDEAAIQALRAQVGYAKLDVREDPPALRKSTAGVYVDLSAIAKGFGVDSIAQYVESLGIDSYLVEVGGEMRTRGHNARDEPWRIAVEQPASGARAVRRVLQPGGNGVATSGDYRNYFERDGNRYSHTIDPRTGQPVAHALTSVTVIHARAAMADAWATALLVLGPDEGHKLAQDANLAAYFVVRKGDGFEDRLSTAFENYLLK